MLKLTNLYCFHSAKIIFLLFRVSARRSRWPGDKTSAGRQSVSNRLCCIRWGITMHFRWCILYYKENSLLSFLRIVLLTGWEACSKIGRAVSDNCGNRKRSWNVHHISVLETHVVGFPEWLQVTYQQLAPVLIIGPLHVSALRHCATSRKVAGSIPNGVIGIFHWHNPSGRTVALGLTQPVTEMSTRNISWG